MSPEPSRTHWATAAEAPVVARLLHDFNVEFDSPTPTIDVLASRWATLLARDDVAVCLATSGTVTTGFAFLTLRPTPYHAGPLAQLEELYVLPALRDSGIGSLLLTEAVDTVRTKGVQEVHINVDEVDVDTRRFYARHGFVNIQPGADHRMLCYLREL